MKEFITAVTEADEEDKDVAYQQPIEFKVDGRVLTAYRPTSGQLTFMLAALGRGQSNDQRFASIINIFMASLRGEDRDYLEERLLERDPSKRIRPNRLEEIFEYLIGEWFADPTQEQSDSANSPQIDGPN